MKIRRATLLVLFSMIAESHAASAGPFAFRNGDRVVFLGDSITQGWNPSEPHTFKYEVYTPHVECALLERFPDLKLTFRNVGWGSDRAWLPQRVQGADMSGDAMLKFAGEEQEKILVRMVTHGLNRDVLPLQPSVLFVMYGANDVRDGTEALRLHTLALREIIRQLRHAGARVVLLAGPPEEPLEGEWNKKRESVVAAERELAAQESVLFIDVFHACLDRIAEERKSNPGFGFTRDGVHPRPPGQLMMARAILAGLGSIDVKLSPESPLAAKVIEKQRAYFHRWREIQVPALLAGKLDADDVRAQLTEADKRIEELETEIDKLRKQKP